MVSVWAKMVRVVKQTTFNGIATSKLFIFLSRENILSVVRTSFHWLALVQRGKAYSFWGSKFKVVGNGTSLEHDII